MQGISSVNIIKTLSVFFTVTEKLSIQFNVIVWEKELNWFYLLGWAEFKSSLVYIKTKKKKVKAS